MTEQPGFVGKTGVLFKQHSRLLTFIGAAIVFATFIVQEKLQAGWKGTADSVELAESQASLRTDLEESMRIQVLFNNRATDEVVVSDSDPNASGREAIKEIDLLNSSMAYLEVVDGRLRISSQMLGKLPPNKSAKTMVQTAVDKSSQMKVQLLSAIEKRGHTEPGSDTDGGMLTASQLAHQVNELDDVAQDDYRSVEKLADETRKRNSFYAGIASWISTTLFVFGWGLGLVAKLVGDDT